MTSNAKLPAELLFKVFENVQPFHNGRPAITSCLRVNKEWQDVALSILYGDVILFGQNQINCFLSCHDRQAIRSITRSLTLRPVHEDDANDNPDERFNTSLLQLANEMIGHMTTLESFSLGLYREELAIKLQVLRSTISTLLKALPINCIDLELDTRVGDWNSTRELEGEPTHLCDDLRLLLPRMRHVHIDLCSICDAMLGKWDLDRKFHPISLPSIQTFHINCTAHDERTECGHDDADWQARQQISPWESVTQALQRVVDLKETANGEIIVWGYSPAGDEHNSQIYRTLLRCHVRSGKDTTTWGFPITHVALLADSRAMIWYTRMDDDAYTMCGLRTMHELAIRSQWRTHTKTPKPPASWNPWSTRGSNEQAGITTEAEWRAKYPRKWTLLWLNEKKTGVRLIDAEERRGFERKSVIEMTPTGFVRPSHPAFNAQLFTPEEWEGIEAGIVEEVVYD